ncbi:MAG: MarC family protein [Thermoplasmata archaeon]|jgi:multiple antibiotic resistance protein
MFTIYQFLDVFIPLFVMIDPFASLALYISLTSNMDENEKKKTRYESTVYGFLILLFFAFAGDYILSLFGISIEALEIAGGILILLIGIEMVREGDKPRISKKGEESFQESGDVGIVPLATPMLAGPGAISLIIILMKSYNYILVLVSMALVFLTVYLFFLYADKVFKLIGLKGSRAFTRILGLLVAAFAVQYILNGISGWLVTFWHA